MSYFIKNYQKILTLLFVGLGFLAVIGFAFYLKNNSQDTRSLGYSGKPVPVEVIFPDIVSTPSAISTPTPSVVKKVSLYLGFSVEPTDDQHLAEINKLIGNRSGIINTYLQWGNPNNSHFTSELFQVFTRRHVTPMITWEPWVPGAGVNQPEYSLSSITGGRHDDYLRQSAREIKRFGQPLFLRFAHEMNGNWYPWGGTVNGNTPSDYITAWRHVYDLFKSENVSNVTWVWSPNAGSVPSTSANDLAKYYPGDNYTDWVALDGYNWGSYPGNNGWHSFDQIFESSYSKLISLTAKPVMIAEVASNEAGGHKNEWFRQFLSPDLAGKYPRLRAIIFFNLQKEVDWRIQSSSSALQGFLGAINRLVIVKEVSLSGGKIVSPR